jgi:hypothetical protein
MHRAGAIALIFVAEVACGGIIDVSAAGDGGTHADSDAAPIFSRSLSECLLENQVGYICLPDIASDAGVVCRPLTQAEIDDRRTSACINANLYDGPTFPCGNGGECATECACVDDGFACLCPILP